MGDYNSPSTRLVIDSKDTDQMSTKRIARDGGRPAAGWSDLPDDLLGTVRSMIFSLHDLVRFAAVCRSWRAAASRQPARAFAPLLLLSSFDDSSGTKHLCGPDDAWVLRAPSKTFNMRTVALREKLKTPTARHYADGQMSGPSA